MNSLDVALTITLLSLEFGTTAGHTRLECPPPRSVRTGAKGGPCDAPDDLSLSPYPLQPGALNTITWLESISHPGAPGRLALSLDGDDSIASFESCLLLDHIPHDEWSLPKFSDMSSWHRSSITVWIPDVYCERCHLQLITVMSDDGHGVPPASTCAYEGAQQAGRASANFPACPAVYHSCSPVSINGTVPRNEMKECSTAEFGQKLNWPKQKGDLSTYYYKGDPGLYNFTTSRLMMTGAPIKDCNNFKFCDPEIYFNMTTLVPDDALYTSMEGTCAAMVTMLVEPFQLGVLPNTPKEMSVEAIAQDQCAMCDQMKPCYNKGCALRDRDTGNWTEQAAQCNEGAVFCEACFPESDCVGFGSGVSEEEVVVTGEDEASNGTILGESESGASVADESKEELGGDVPIPLDDESDAEVKEDNVDAEVEVSNEEDRISSCFLKHRLSRQAFVMLGMAVVGILQF